MPKPLRLDEIPEELIEHSRSLGHAINYSSGWYCLTCSQRKVAICEYMISINEETPGHPFIAPTAIDWLGDGMVKAIVEAEKKALGE